MEVYGSYGLLQRDLIVTIGASLIFDVECRDKRGYPIDLSGFKAAMVVKTKEETLDWSEYLTLSDGNIHVHVPHKITKDVIYPGNRTAKFQHGTWDMSLVSDTEDVIRLVYGRVEVADTDSPKVVITE